MEPQVAKIPATRLAISINRCFLPLCTGFVEQSARAFGLGDSEALSLTLAAEEIFNYLADGPACGQNLDIACLGNTFQVATVFTLPTNTLNLRAFNFTFRPALNEDQLPADLGLLIASRTVDHLQFDLKAGKFRLTLSKDKAYPALEHKPLLMPRAEPAVTFRRPDPAELLLLLNGLMGLSPGRRLPPEFAQPGKVVDMAGAGLYGALIAVDPAGRLGGGLLWHRLSDQMVECFGPYLFGQPAATARSLLDHLLGVLAKTPAVGLLNRYPTPDLPSGYFEVLGAWGHHARDGSLPEIPVHYRSLEEDTGAVAWTHPALRAFIAKEYERLAFARDLITLSAAGERISPYSVLTTEFNRPAGVVTLRPIWWGEDAECNLREHVRVLRQEGLRDLFFEQDLGRSWQSHFTPALLAAGFSPMVILPHGGHGDLLMFEHRGGDLP